MNTLSATRRFGLRIDFWNMESIRNQQPHTHHSYVNVCELVSSNKSCATRVTSSFSCFRCRLSDFCFVSPFLLSSSSKFSVSSRSVRQKGKMCVCGKRYKYNPQHTAHSRPRNVCKCLTSLFASELTKKKKKKKKKGKTR